MPTPQPLPPPPFTMSRFTGPCAGALALVLALSACGGNSSAPAGDAGVASGSASGTPVADASNSATTAASTGSPASVAGITTKDPEARYRVTRIVQNGTFTAMSLNGHVIGRSTDPGLINGDFLWSRDGGLVAIPTFGPSQNKLVSVNDAGVVVGTHAANRRFIGEEPWRWSVAQGATRLASPAGIAGTSFITVMLDSISNSGLTFGSVVGTQGGPAPIAVWWAADGSPAAIVPDGGPWQTSFVSDSNAAGQAVGTRREVGYFWTPASAPGAETLPLPRGGLTHSSLAIGPGGTVAGLVGSGAGAAKEPFTWSQEAGLEVLPISVATNQSPTFSVAREGQVVSTLQVGGRPFCWLPQVGLVDLLGQAGTSGQASRINGDGVVVGWYRNGDEAAQRAFAWTEAAGLIDLNSRIDPALGLHLDNAVAVSEDGAIVAVSGAGLVMLSPAPRVSHPVPSS